MRTFLRFSAISAAASLLLPQVASAFCPLCTLAVGAGVGLSRWFGIDDTLTGLWVGGFMVSITGWTIDWFNRKHIRFKGRIILTTLFYYGLLLLLPLYLWTDLLTHPLNTLWGVNRLLLGIIVGSIVFLAAGLWYGALKRRNHGRAWFKGQKVVWPVGSLIIATVVFYVITLYSPTIL
ncbi:MAG: hypothetical protein WCS85_05360 [Candidatus Peribacteraceae bacterium]